MIRQSWVGVRGSSELSPTPCGIVSTEKQWISFLKVQLDLSLRLFSESVRLVRSHQVCAGSVEVKSNQGWVPVCPDGFDSEAEKVVCRELGCGPPQTFLGSFSEGEETVLSKQFQCKGNESRLEDCASSIRNDCKPAARISCSMYQLFHPFFTAYGKTLM